MSALIDLPLQDWFYDGSSKAQTLNLGSLGGSLQLGDGITPSQIMTFVGGGKRGVNTCEPANNQRVLYHPTFPALGTNGTLYALVYFSPATIAEAVTHAIFLQGLAASYTNGILLSQNGSNLLVYWNSAASLLSTTLTAGVHSVATTYDGATISLYLDGNRTSGAVVGKTSSNTSLSIGGEYLAAGFSALRSSRIYDAKVYNYALEETQIRNLHQRSLARINLY